MLYQINKGTKFYGTQTVLDDINFSVDENEKLAIIGRNGAGKTTLLKIMMGEVLLESGEIHKATRTKIGYLSQHVFNDESLSVEEIFQETFSKIVELERKVKKIEAEMNHNYSEELLDEYAKLSHQFEEQGGYTYQSEIMTLLTKFGFQKEDYKKEITHFSGGQKTRLALIDLLLSKPDILLLDEPTNHLDLETIQWLEGYLKKYPKAIIFVSHDRKFIDQIATSICEVRYGKVTKYHGNYTKYVEQKKINEERQHSSYQRQTKEIQRIEQQIEKFRTKATKASFAQSKIKYLERMDRVEDIRGDEKVFKADFHSARKGGKLVLESDQLAIGYDDILATISMKIFHGEKIAVIGANGIGKSTFLKTITNKIGAKGGEFILGHQIDIGYFDQDVSILHANKTVIDELWDRYPTLTQTEIRTILGTFLFEKDEVFKYIQDLSGGEKVRLLLVILMLAHDNFLLMDEPTNHLDLDSKEVLEQSLNSFDGTMVFVSHDRYFISKIATSLLLFEEHQVILISKTYDEYMEENKEIELVLEKDKKNKSRVKNIDYKKEVKKVETRIATLEDKIKEIEELQFLEENYSDFKKMEELNLRISEFSNELMERLEEWEEYSQYM